MNVSELLYVGIDPGKTGAIAIMNEHYLVDVFDMPLREINGKDVVNAREIYERLLLFRERIAGFYHELVHSMPKDGSASAFKFGVSAGKTIAACEILNKNLVMITPQEWKKHYGLIRTDKNAKVDKQASIDIAKERFNAHDFLTLKKHHGRAEAILIAAYGRYKFANFIKARNAYKQSQEVA